MKQASGKGNVDCISKLETQIKITRPWDALIFIRHHVHCFRFGKANGYMISHVNLAKTDFDDERMHHSIPYRSRKLSSPAKDSSENSHRCHTSAQIVHLNAINPCR